MPHNIVVGPHLVSKVVHYIPEEDVLQSATIVKLVSSDHYHIIVNLVADDPETGSGLFLADIDYTDGTGNYPYWEFPTDHNVL